MADRCETCASPAVGEFDALVLSGRSVASASRQTGVALQSAYRHARAHIAREPAPEPRGDDQFAELIASLMPRALKGDPAASREVRALLAAQSEARSAPPAYDVALDPAWIELRSRILDALEGYPDALAAVRDALERP